MIPPRTLVIGGGLAGIAALKSSLERDAEEHIVLYERTSNIGGIWSYTGKKTDEQVTCAKTTTTNTSKEFFAFSDYKFSDSTPNFVRNSVIREYMEGYRDHFKLNDKIVYNRAVVKVTPVAGSQVYKVISKDVNTAEESVEEFDFIYVCNGRYAKQKNVTFPGQNKFKGKIIYSRNYMEPDEFTGQEVCIVGIGNTATDIAVDLSKICKKVHISTRSGTYIMRRCGNQGLPLDLVPFTRYFQNFMRIMPTSFTDNYAEKTCNMFFDHELYGIKPSERFSKVFITINDDIPNRIITGEIKIHRNIKCFTENGVIFENDEEEVKTDTVIMATGYEFNTHFLDESIVKVTNNNLPLYNYMVLPERRNIAFIGYLSPQWSVPPIFEMQSRYMARVFKGDIELPGNDTMKEKIELNDQIRKAVFQDSSKFTLQCYGFPYMEMLAEEIGCRPNFWKILLTDPRLAITFCFELMTAAHYRLVGPNSCKNARSDIMDMRRRIEWPYGEQRAMKQVKERAKQTDKIIYCGSALIFIVFAILFKICFI